MRRLLLLICLLLTLATLGACGGDDDAATDAGGESTTDGAADDGHAEEDWHGHADDAGGSSPVAEGARRIEVEGTSFEFDPSSITAEVGEDIAIELTSSDILHDLVIDELDAHVVADAGETAEGGFRADEAGSYTYYCSVPGHRDAGMEGTLIVREP